MSSSRRSRQEILDIMRAAIRELGKPPGRATFSKPPWNVPENDVKYHFGNHSKLIIAAGGVPNPPKQRIPLSDLFREYARACLHLGYMPTQAELRIVTRELGTRTWKLEDHFGGLEAANEEFWKWLHTPEGKEFAEILDFPGWGRKPFGMRRRVTEEVGSASQEVSAVTKEISSVPADRYPNLPAGLLQLSTLAWNRLPPQLGSKASASLLFEQKCAEAFQALGFEIHRLGQGKGRGADCLAIARSERFGVIIDAKAREKGFALSADEDRQLRDYAETHSDELRDDGIERIYLCVVSSSFREEDNEAFGEALTGSGIHGWSLWPADVLMAAVERSIAERSKFHLGNLETRFALNSIVTQQRLVPSRRSCRR